MSMTQQVIARIRLHESQTGKRQDVIFCSRTELRQLSEEMYRVRYGQLADEYDPEYLTDIKVMGVPLKEIEVIL